MPVRRCPVLYSEAETYVHYFLPPRFLAGMQDGSARKQALKKAQQQLMAEAGTIGE